MNIAVKIVIYLIVFYAFIFISAWVCGASINWTTALAGAFACVVVAYALIKNKVVKPVEKFVDIADKIVDGDYVEGYKELKICDMEQLQGSFTQIFSSLIESKVAIEEYMKTIGDMNKELNEKVDSLSALYYASQAMGGSLNIDTLARNFISIFCERLGVSGAGLMLYSDKNDTVSVKDLVGISPDLFGKFKFYSDHRILAEVFSDKCYWMPTEQEINMLVAEFDTDELRRLKLVLPMRIKDHFVGLLILAEKKDGEEYKKSDLELFQAMAGLASTSINNSMLFEKSAETKNALDHKVFNLMTLQQASKVLCSTLNLEELINISIDMFLETVWANKGVLMLASDEGDCFEVKAFKGITQEEVEALKEDLAETWVMTTIEKEKRPIFSHDLSGKGYQACAALNRELAFAVYVPMLKEGELYGIVKVGSKINGEDFTENDLEFFETLASQAVIAFENARLYSLAITDSITKLYVHRYFQFRLEEEVARSRRYNSTISLLMCDIDHFKMVNDTYGHQQGDCILREVSKIIRKNVRNTDIPARYGGEEFAIILPETTQADAKIVAERIRRDVDKFEFPSIMEGQPPVKCSISIGVAGFPLNADNKDQLIQKADSALYKAKDGGRNRVVLFGVDS